MNSAMKPIPGFNGAYAATKDGRIYSFIKNKYLKPKVHKNGYAVVCLVDPDGIHRDLLIHRLVCFTFHGQPKIWQTEVNHKDGNKLNNSADNLEWCSRRENMLHASQSGLMDPVAEAARKTCLSRRKPVKGIDKDGNTVCTFDSVVDARKAGYSKVSDVLLGNRKTAGGLKWEYITTK